MKLKLTRRERTLVTLALALAVAAGFYFLGLEPIIGRIGALNQEMAALSADLKLAAGFIRQSAAMREEIARLEGELVKQAQAIPESIETPWLLLYLAQAEQFSGARVTGLSYGTPEAFKELFDTPIQLEVRGGYWQQMAFASRLEAIERAAYIRSVSLVVLADGQLRARIDWHLLTRTGKVGEAPPPGGLGPVRGSESNPFRIPSGGATRP
ncbi:MAG: type 4a pilus biogenesis protein PilO [Bacillota bacterium]